MKLGTANDWIRFKCKESVRMLQLIVQRVHSDGMT